MELKEIFQPISEELSQVEGELKEQINNLANPFYLEKIACEKLGLAKKEEIVYRILPDTR